MLTKASTACLFSAQDKNNVLHHQNCKYTDTVFSVIEVHED